MIRRTTENVSAASRTPAAYRDTEAPVVEAVRRARCAQEQWRAVPLRERLQCIRRFRQRIANDPSPCIDAIERSAVQRQCGQTLTAEVWPLLDACRFLERRASRLLRPRRYGVRDRPIWLWGSRAEVRREPIGTVLIIGPSNYPWLLPGVQAVQALAAGNTVLLKPGRGATEPTRALVARLHEAGVPSDAIQQLDASNAAGLEAIHAGVDHVVLTGSSDAGRAVLRAAADALTPVTAELSGCDAMVVLGDADIEMVINAVCFGVTFNGGATCIAPRRLLATPDVMALLQPRLREMFESLPPCRLRADTANRVRELAHAAEQAGAERLAGAVDPDGSIQPMLLDHVTADMPVAQADLFAPLLNLITIGSAAHACEAERHMRYRLGASIFGPTAQAQRLAQHWPAGCVCVNDLIAPTADPRLPFAGRGESGFGVTRGAEGLLAMTQPKTIITRRGRHRPHYNSLDTNATRHLTTMMRLVHGGFRHRGYPDNAPSSLTPKAPHHEHG